MGMLYATGKRDRYMSRQSSSSELDKLRERVNELTASNERLRAEIAERDSSALAMLQSEQLLLALLNKVPVGIFATDTDGNFLFVNEVWSEIVGISLEQAVGQGWINALHPDDRENVLKA